MTAEEYMIENMKGADYQEIESALIEFATLKCKELLEIVAEKAKVKNTLYYSGQNNIETAFDFYSEQDGRFEICKDSILNAVDLDSFIV